MTADAGFDGDLFASGSSGLLEPGNISQTSTPIAKQAAAEELGYKVAPRFLKVLREVSGRER